MGAIITSLNALDSQRRIHLGDVLQARAYRNVA
jgi:hypothetical protein